MCRTRDEFQIMPAGLVGLYRAQRAGKSLSKTEACRLMNVDHAITSPSYAGGAAEHRLVDIRVDAEYCCRHLLVSTGRLIARVEAELRAHRKAVVGLNRLALKTAALTRSCSATGSSTFFFGGRHTRFAR